MDPAPGPGRGHGLVGALAARRHVEAAPEHRLARSGEAGRLDDHVGVEAPDDDDGTAVACSHGV